MSATMPRPGHGRHPVGLTIVIALHLAVAALLVLNSKLKWSPPPKPPIDTTLIDDRKIVPPEPTKTLDSVKPTLPTYRPPEFDPRIVADPDTTIIVPHSEGPVNPAGDLGRHDDGPTLVAVVSPHPSLARHAQIDARNLACRPEYPMAAARANAEGVSRIRFTVDSTGHVIAATTLSSSGPTREHRLLDRAAADALQHCPITPGQDADGHATGTTVDVEYAWTLN